MRNLRHYVLAIALVVLCGCSNLTIDASSNESMKQSFQKIREALPESKLEEFYQAVGELAFHNITVRRTTVHRRLGAVGDLAFPEIKIVDLSAQGTARTKDIGRNLRKALNGKTVEQVIAEAQRKRAARTQRERQQALEEIRELEANRAKTESARNEIKKFEVVRSQIHMRDSESMGKHPIIELTVRNGTSQTVFKAHFESTLTSPDRSTPWSTYFGLYFMSRGLKPGEETTWYITPIMMPDWDTMNTPKDAVFTPTNVVFTITFVQLDDRDGEPIYSTRQFSEYHQKRLNQLKEKYGIE